MLLSMGLVITIKIVELARPWALSKVIDLIVGHQNSEVMSFLGFFVAISCVSAVLIPFQKLMSSQLLEKSRKRKSLEWSAEILNKNPAIMHKVPAAQITEAFYRARHAFAIFSYQLLESHLINTLVILVILGYILLLKMYWILPLIILSAALMTWLSRIMTKKIEPLYREGHVLGDRFKSYLADLYASALPIQLTGLLNTAIKPFEAAIQKQHAVITECSFWQVLIASSSTLIIWLMQGLILAIGVFFLKDQLDMSAGSILGAYFYSSILIEKLRELSSLYMDSSKWRTSQEALLNLLDDPYSNLRFITKSPHPTTFDVTIHPFSIKIGDKNLSLNQPVKIPYGSKVGVLGESGSGKTFFAELLSGCVHHPGIVSLGDVDVAHLSPDQRGHIFSYGESKGKFLSGSMVQSVFLGRPPIQDIIPLLKDLGLEKYIGLAHQGEFIKSNLSAGEQKRFELLKNLADPSAIVILDAPVESLNSSLVHRIWPLIQSRLAAHTLICVTHNKDLVAEFDLLLCIEEGQIRAEPNHLRSRKNHDPSQ